MSILRVSIAVVACVALLAGTAFAEPIVITQTYSNQTDQAIFAPSFEQGAPGEMFVNGAWMKVTGDWVFKILTDTSNPDLYNDPSQERRPIFAHENYGVFATTSIWVSNTGLGLVDVKATNFIYYTEVVDFQSGISGAIAPDFSSADIEGPDGSVGDPNVIEAGKLDYVKRTTPTRFGSPGIAGFGFFSSIFGPGHMPLILEDGTTLQGFYAFRDAKQVSSAPVPEPGTFALLALIGGAWMCRRRRKA